MRNEVDYLCARPRCDAEEWDPGVAGSRYLNPAKTNASTVVFPISKFQRHIRSHGKRQTFSRNGNLRSC